MHAVPDRNLSITAELYPAITTHVHAATDSVSWRMLRLPHAVPDGCACMLCLQDKEAKVTYLNKIIAVVGLALGEDIPARPHKVRQPALSSCVATVTS